MRYWHDASQWLLVPVFTEGLYEYWTFSMSAHTCVESLQVICQVMSYASKDNRNVSCKSKFIRFYSGKCSLFFQWMSLFKAEGFAYKIGRYIPKIWLRQRVSFWWYTMNKKDRKRKAWINLVFWVPNSEDLFAIPARLMYCYYIILLIMCSLQCCYWYLPFCFQQKASSEIH